MRHTIEGEACKADRHDHGQGDAQVVPVSSVVPSPDGADSLGAREEGSAQHKGTIAIAAIHRLSTLLQALHCTLAVTVAP